MGLIVNSNVSLIFFHPSLNYISNFTNESTMGLMHNAFIPNAFKELGQISQNQSIYLKGLKVMILIKEI